MVYFGDFNDLLYASDKMGTNSHPQALMDGFCASIDDCNLTKIDLEGGNFTWEKIKGTSNWVRERLDRAFASFSQWQKFPLCKLNITHTIVSNHDPIFLELCHVSFSRKNFRFKFENTWLKEPNFNWEVSYFWNLLSASHLLPKLLSVSSFMTKWGRRFFINFVIK